MNAVKTFAIWLIVLLFLAFVGWQAFMFLRDQSQPRVDLTLKGYGFKTRLALTDDQRKQGLSGLKSLDQTEAMLFVFPSDDTWGMWMKDMNFPIDIVWLNKGRKIVYMVKSADPSSYPYTTFKPTAPARYVIEFAAGTIALRAFSIGDTASFDISSEQEAGT